MSSTSYIDGRIDFRAQKKYVRGPYKKKRDQKALAVMRGLMSKKATLWGSTSVSGEISSDDDGALSASSRNSHNGLSSSADISAFVQFQTQKMIQKMSKNSNEPSDEDGGENFKFFKGAHASRKSSKSTLPIS